MNVAESLQIEKLLVVKNGESALAGHVQTDVVDRLQDSSWSKKFEVQGTIGPDFAENVEHLAQFYEPGQALLVAGGDGLVNIVTNGLQRTPSEVRESTYMIPLPFGGGNDASRSLHGHMRRDGFVDVLERGFEHDVDLLEVSFGNVRRVAFSYVGLGFTALGSDRLNRPKYRAMKRNTHIPGKLLDPVVIATLLLRTSKHEPAQYNDSYNLNDTSNHEVGELLFAVQRSVAGGFIKIETPEPGKAICIEVPNDHFVRSVLWRVTKQGMLGMRGEHIVGRSLIMETDTKIQLDGEVEEVPVGTAVHVNVLTGNQSILALGKKPPRQPS